MLVRHLCVRCVFLDVWHLLFFVHEMRGALWVRCQGSFLSLRHFIGRRSLYIHVPMLGLKKKNYAPWGWVQKRRSEELLLLLLLLFYPLTARVVGASQMISQPVSSILPCSSLPSGTWQNPGLSIPWCCFPTSSSVCLVFSPLALCRAKTYLKLMQSHCVCKCRCG